MRNLQYIQLRSHAVRETRGQQLRIDLFLGIATEQHVARTEVQLEHDRGVVDLLAPVGRADRHRTSERPLDLETDSVEPDRVSRGDDPGCAAVRREQLAVRGVARPWPGHARFRDRANSIARQQQRQSGDMIFVRVGQHDGVDAPVPRRDALI